VSSLLASILGASLSRRSRSPILRAAGSSRGRVKILREAFAKIINDPDVAVEPQKKGLDPNLVSGNEIEGLVKELIAMPPEVVQRMKKLLE
jgi:tripartite-type tricarboxylate transporter receptor subunit TctC